MGIQIIILSILLFGCTKESQPLSTTSSSSVSALEKIPIVILAGQSNMAGGDGISTPPVEFTGPIPNALIFYKSSYTTINNGTIQTLQWGVNNDFGNPTFNFGPECAIGYYVTQAGLKIGIIKYAVDASELSNGNFTSAGVWETTAVVTLPKRNHYQHLKAYFVKPGLDSFRAHGYDPYIVALCWTQGETDSQDSVSIANQYKAKLIQLITQFKGAFPAETSRMHVIITRTYPGLTHAGYERADIVRAAQVSIADSIPRGHWINSDQFPMSDFIHYSKLGQIEQGRLIADILITVIKNWRHRILIKHG